METCTSYLGDNKAVSDWAQKNKLVRADEEFSKAALKGESGEVWGASDSIGQFLIVLTGELQCSTWARTANVQLANENFVTYQVP